MILPLPISVHPFWVARVLSSPPSSSLLCAHLFCSPYTYNQMSYCLPSLPASSLSLLSIHIFAGALNCFALFLSHTCPHRHALRVVSVPVVPLPPSYQHFILIPPPFLLSVLSVLSTHTIRQTYKPRHIHVRALPARTLPHHMHKNKLVNEERNLVFQKYIGVTIHLPTT